MGKMKEKEERQKKAKKGVGKKKWRMGTEGRRKKALRR